MAPLRGATLIPHPPLIWEQIRAYDMLFLLALGAASELLFRFCVLLVKRKPARLKRKEDYFFKLQYDTQKKQAQGPAFFVETSVCVPVFLRPSYIVTDFLFYLVTIIHIERNLNVNFYPLTRNCSSCTKIAKLQERTQRSIS